MKRIELMELVRARQVDQVSRREFLQRAAAFVGSAVAANALLVACAGTSETIPPPVVDDNAPTPVPATATVAGMTTGIITYPGPDGTELMGYLAVEAGAAPRPGVIVIQEWWGLDDHIKDVADRLAGAGFVALAPDLYHGQVATEPDEARKLAMELVAGEAVSEIRAAMSYLRAQDSTTDAVGIIGFCMGGGLVLQTAVTAGDDLDAGIVFYGAPLNATQAAQVSAPIQTFLGTRDGISSSQVQAMHDAFEANGLPNNFQLYEGAQHAFFNDNRASFHPEAAADAWERTLNWFQTHLNA